jgi:hypothetical protein
MANDKDLYFEPTSQGACDVLSCSELAKYRASWAQGVIVKLVCATHKEEFEGKRYDELSPSVFGKKRPLRTFVP